MQIRGLVYLFSNLLKQFILAKPSISKEMQTLYTRHSNRKTRPRLDEITQTLFTAISSFSQVFLVIDALDELYSPHRTTLLSEIHRLQARTGLNFMVTSRHIPEIIPEIREKFEGSLQLEIYATDVDVKKYLRGQIYRLPDFVRKNESLQDSIVCE